LNIIIQSLAFEIGDALDTDFAGYGIEGFLYPY
jgi:hypothetical protein